MHLPIPPSQALKQQQQTVAASPLPSGPSTIRRRIADTVSKNWTIDYDELEFHKKIGAGSFGEVWTAELWGMEW